MNTLINFTTILIYILGILLDIDYLAVPEQLTVSARILLRVTETINLNYTPTNLF